MMIADYISKQEFTVRNHQLETEVAATLKITDLLKEYDPEDRNNPFDRRVAISKADIILIFSLYEDGVKEFYRLYKEYVEECQKKRWKVCDLPHWFLKRSVD